MKENVIKWNLTEKGFQRTTADSSADTAGGRWSRSDIRRGIIVRFVFGLSTWTRIPETAPADAGD